MPADPPPDWVLSRCRQVGLRIARIRRDRGLAVDDVAEVAGLDRETVMTAEAGSHAVDLDTLLIVAHTLGVPLAELFHDESATAETAATDDQAD